MIDNKELDEIKEIKQDALNRNNVQRILQEFDEGKPCSDADAKLVMQHQRKHPEEYDKLRSFLTQNYNRVVTSNIPERKFFMGM